MSAEGLFIMASMCFPMPRQCGEDTWALWKDHHIWNQKPVCVCAVAVHSLSLSVLICEMGMILSQRLIFKADIEHACKALSTGGHVE